MKKEKEKIIVIDNILIIGLLIFLVIGGLIFVSKENISQSKTPNKEIRLKEAQELLDLSESNIDSLINTVEDGAIVNGYMTESEAMGIFKKNLQVIDSAKTTIRQLANEGYSVAEITLTQITILDARIEKKKNILVEDLVLASYGRVREKDKFANPIYN